MTSISLNNVSKQFQDVQAVDQINIEIPDGEFITFVGPSGCGKTTTLRVIAGLESVSEGIIRFSDKDVTNNPPNKRNVGMVFQNLALYPHMSVRENMAFGLSVDGVPEQEQEEKIQEAARILDIEELLDRKPKQLSGGQQQRVAIGRTIVLDPDVFLLDEPLASLDAKLRVNIREELQELQNQIGITTIYVTHDQEQAMTMSDRIVVMNEGEVQQFATPSEVYNNPSNEFVANFIGTPSINIFEGEMRLNNGNTEIDLGFHTISFDSNIDRKKQSQDVRVGIRPEHIQLELNEQSLGQSQFSAPVKFVEPTGKENIVHLEYPDGEFTAIMPGEAKIEDANTYNIHFENEHIHIFNPASGKNILNHSSTIQSASTQESVSTSD